jgi:hypothetical protein
MVAPSGDSASGKFRGTTAENLTPRRQDAKDEVLVKKPRIDPPSRLHPAPRYLLLWLPAWLQARGSLFSVPCSPASDLSSFFCVLASLREICWQAEHWERLTVPRDCFALPIRGVGVFEDQDDDSHDFIRVHSCPFVVSSNSGSISRCGR